MTFDQPSLHRECYHTPWYVDYMESFWTHFSEAQQQNDRKNTVNIFEKGMPDMLKEALNKRDFIEVLPFLLRQLH